MLAAAISLAAAGGARADVFGSISLVSANQLEQSTIAEHPAMSGNGQYVAFDGSFGSVRGVWRKDLLTGLVQRVAVGAIGTPESDAQLPSISANGRYVSFTTTARLDEKNDVNPGPDVYVRDMNDPDAKPCPVQRSEGEPCAFDLVSAVDGSAQGLSYSYGGGAEEKTAGSVASGRSALTADGRHVAFVTTAFSNLAGSETPPLQVAVRDLDSKHTRLVSVAFDSATGKWTGEPVRLAQQASSTYGAVFHESAGLPRFPSPEAPSFGASISGDGSTVTWLGQQIEAQAPLLPIDQARAPIHAEPLWRRLADGVNAPTRRVSGGSDLENPQCAGRDESQLQEPATLLDPCQGPFAPLSSAGIEPASGMDYLPRLSENGQTVAFLANTPLVEGGEFGSAGSFSDDLFVVNMQSGLTRVQALRRLTAIAAGSSGAHGRVEPIEDLGVSADGEDVAFTSRRTVFPLGSPNYVSQQLAAPATESGPQELYVVDFENDTLTRVTHGFDGEPTAAPAQSRVTALAGSPSFSADGYTIAFSSIAPNLVYGDGNEASDVFVVSRERFGSSGTQQYISPPPGNPEHSPDWILGARAKSRRDGSVLLEVFVPGAGQLTAEAQGAVIALAGSVAHAGRRRHRASRSHGARTVVIRTVAKAARASAGEGALGVPLVLTAHYRSLALAAGGFSATARLAFASPGHRLVRVSMAVRFIEVVHRQHKRARKGSHR